MPSWSGFFVMRGMLGDPAAKLKPYKTTNQELRA
jgi:hypothetical protein